VSGRPKGPVPVAADELRQLTREANEATRDLRAVLRELRAARDELGTSVDKLIAARVDAHMEGLNQHVKDSESVITASFENGQRIIEQQHATLMGTTTPKALIELLTRTFMEKVHEPENLKVIADHVAAHLEVDIVVGSAKGRCRL
jgi:uncharacterized coiled-coil DUF342 family protein